MATITCKPKIDIKINFSIDESEARALDALVGYGDDAFIKTFYDKLGASYMINHELGLRLFFTSIRSFMPGYLEQLDNAKKAFNK